MSSLSDTLKQQAHTLGFELVGIAPAAPADDFQHLQRWLARGFGGEMDYMSRHAQARKHPESILSAVRSVVMVGLSYRGARVRVSAPRQEGHAPTPPRSPGRVARYAQGADYHDVLRAKLKRLLAWVQGQSPGTRGRAVVDTAPLLERDFARRAGLGWIGKNTMLLNKKQGSYFFLGALLLDIDLPADLAHQASHCGTCTACLDACPTQAFAGPGQLDARRCISYLTIELRASIPDELRPRMGDWLFGCDVCQEVCPWNRKAPSGTEPRLQHRAELEGIDPAELLSLSEEQFHERFHGTALTRPRRGGLLRNAAIVLGNTGDARAFPALRHALADSDALVREAAAWAILQIEERQGHSRRSV
jgi:epoxyqueuosine reductase